MAIRNTNLGGGSNWGTETLTSTDLNDTFNGLTDAAPLKVDRTNARVGINNASPAAALDVTGSQLLSGTITMQAGKPLGKITLSASDPSGGNDGDLWLKY